MTKNSFELFQEEVDAFKARRHKVNGDIMDLSAQIQGLNGEYDIALLNQDQKAMAAIQEKIDAATKAIGLKQREVDVLESHGIQGHAAVMQLAEKVVAGARNEMGKAVEDWMACMEAVADARRAYLTAVGLAGAVYRRAESINNMLAVVRESTGAKIPWLPQGTMTDVNLHRERGVIYITKDSITKTFKEGVQNHGG